MQIVEKPKFISLFPECFNWHFVRVNRDFCFENITRKFVTCYSQDCGIYLATIGWACSLDVDQVTRNTNE